jgi:hypothetical protein
MSYPTKYPQKEFLKLPTDAELGIDLANFCHGEAQNLNDGRMMLGAGLVGTDSKSKQTHRPRITFDTSLKSHLAPISSIDKR